MFCLNRKDGVSKLNGVRIMFHELFSSINEPMLIINTDGEVEYFNKNAQELLNMAEDKKNKLEMDEHSKSSWTFFLNKIREQKSGSCLLNLKFPDCHYKKVKFFGYFFEKKKLIFVRIKTIIATSYKEIKEKYSSFLLDELSHGVVITDLEGMILDVNKKALQFLLCDYDEIINTSHKSIFDKLEDYEYNKLKFYQEIKNLGQASIVLRNVIGDEEQYYKIDSKLNVKKNIIVSTITNITTEIELHNQMKQQDFTKELCQVAASIAHEIGNPMTSLKGFIDLLKYSTSKEYVRYLNVMESELNRIDKILNDLVNLAKPSKEVYEKINIKNVVNEVVELMQPHAIKHNIIITIRSGNVSNDTAIFGSEHRIKQVLINLIKNAIEVMDNGGGITVAITNINNNMIQLSVQDEGTGIPEEHIESLFKPFYTTKKYGTGLGLSIVKKIIEEHNGKIKVESVLNNGTTFFIEFPMYDENSEFIKDDEKIVNIWYNKPINSLPIT